MGWHVPLYDGIPQWKSHFEHSWAWVGSSTLPFFYSFLWFLVTPRDAINPVQTSITLSRELSLRLQREKWGHFLSCWLKEMSASVLFSNLATESLLSFIFSGHYSTSPPQFYLHFFFPSTSSSQAKACLSLPLKNLSPAQGAIHSVATSLKSKLQTETRGWARRNRRKRDRAFEFWLHTFLLYFLIHRFIIF